MTHSLKEAGLQKSVLILRQAQDKLNRNLIPRPVELVEQAHHCSAQSIPKDSIGRLSRYRRKEFALTYGGLGLGLVFLYTKKAAEVIVPIVTSEDC